MIIDGPDTNADGIADRADLGRHDDDVAPPDPRPLVAGQPPGQSDMALRHASGIHRHGRVDAVAPHEQLGDRLDRRGLRPCTGDGGAPAVAAVALETGCWYRRRSAGPQCRCRSATGGT